jgi:hypothetical protein
MYIGLFSKAKIKGRNRAVEHISITFYYQVTFKQLFKLHLREFNLKLCLRI